MAKYQSYVICTSPRSGSTLLCKLLAETRVAGNPESLFHTPSISDWLSNINLPLNASTSQQDQLLKIFSAAQEYGKGSSDIFGLRLQQHSFNFFIKQVSSLYPKLPNDHEKIQNIFGKTLFIHLSRKDKINQAVSYVKAKQTGLWHLASDGTELERLSEPRPPAYDAIEIADQVNELTNQDNAWNSWFTREGISPLRVCYDELSEDPKLVLTQILDELGLDPIAAKGIKPAVRKLSDKVNQDWKERFTNERDQYNLARKFTS